MATLYELTADYQQLLELAEDPDIDPEVIADTLEGLDGEIEIKADGYAKVIRQLEADSAALKGEEERLAKRRRTIENNIANMKNTLQASMMITGKTKFKTELFSFGIRKNPASVIITDESRVTHDFMIPQPPKIDKKAIKQALNEGFAFDWAHLEQTESLQIR